MSNIASLLSQLPIDQLASQVGASEEETRQAVDTLIPALLGGLEANAADPVGAASLASALGDHDPSLLDEPSLDRIDTADGAKIVSNIFGAQEPEVVQRLGGSGALDSGLVRKLLPILAPIVLAWLARQLQDQVAGGGMSPDPAQGQPQGAQGGVGEILGQILGGALTQGGGGQPSLGGGLLGSILGGLLGGGRR